MERYTARGHDGGAYVVHKSEWTDVERTRHEQEALNKLADYEDIGLTPGQIMEVDKLYSELCKELGEYKRLEKQGLLIRVRGRDTTGRYRPGKEELARDLDNGLVTVEIAKKYGYKSPSSITTFMRKYGLSSKKRMGKALYANTDKSELMEFIEGRIGEVKALYTNGPFSLKKLAVEYSVDEGVLHEVLSAKGLLKRQQ